MALFVRRGSTASACTQRQAQILWIAIDHLDVSMRFRRDRGAGHVHGDAVVYAARSVPLGTRLYNSSGKSSFDCR